MSDSAFDVVVIGAGPGGYVAAIRASQLGLKTAIIEKKSLGGTCLNVGCIPSKALLHSTELVHALQHQAKANGIQVEGMSTDLTQMMARKDKVVANLCNGVKTLLKKKGVTHVQGLGSISAPGKVTVSTEDGDQQLSAKNIILATGSAPVELPFMPFDGETVVSSDEAIAFTEVPKKLTVVGAGAIGLELGSVWARLGSEVTVVEFLPKVVPNYDDDICKLAERIFKRQGLKIHTQTKVTGLRVDGDQQFLQAEKKGKELEIETDKVLVAVGRRPYSDQLGLAEAGVELDDKKRVVTDGHFKTNIDGIYAIGDLIAGPMLAHKAEDEGVAVAEIIAGKAGHVNYDAVPGVVYTDPEIAGVGLSEQQAKEKGLEVVTGKFGIAANGRAIASDATEGIVKVIADKQTDKLLGVHMIAKGASEMIAAAVTHMEYGGSAEDLARTIHAHPTISESMKEAAMAADGRAIHAL